jgi:hypothetical protein
MYKGETVLLVAAIYRGLVNGKKQVCEKTIWCIPKRTHQTILSHLFSNTTNAFPHLAEGHYFFEKLFPLNSAYHG